MEAKYLYMLVTFDKYELPLIVEDSVEKLARRAGVTNNAVYQGILKVKNGVAKRSRYVRVQV